MDISVYSGDEAEYYEGGGEYDDSIDDNEWMAPVESVAGSTDYYINEWAGDIALDMYDGNNRIG